MRRRVGKPARPKPTPARATLVETGDTFATEPPHDNTRSSPSGGDSRGCPNGTSHRKWRRPGCLHQQSALHRHVRLRPIAAFNAASVPIIAATPTSLLIALPFVPDPAECSACIATVDTMGNSVWLAERPMSVRIRRQLLLAAAVVVLSHATRPHPTTSRPLSRLFPRKLNPSGRHPPEPPGPPAQRWTEPRGPERRRVEELFSRRVLSSCEQPLRPIASKQWFPPKQENGERSAGWSRTKSWRSKPRLIVGGQDRFRRRDEG